MRCEEDTSTLIAFLTPVRITEVIARGAFGEIFRTTSSDNLVVKRVLSEGLGEEVRIQVACKHPCVLEVLDLLEVGNFSYLLLPLADMDLSALFSRGGIDSLQMVGFAGDLLSALDHVHSLGYIHRDVKPANLLLRGGTLLLADFGLARRVEDPGEGAMSGYVATRWYRSPEVAGGYPYTTSLDIWSVGVILWEALHGGSPMFPATTGDELLPLIQLKLGGIPEHLSPLYRNHRRFVSRDVSEGFFSRPAAFGERPLRDIVRHTLVWNPHRPSARVLLERLRKTTVQL